MYTEAKRRASKRWDDANIKRLGVVVRRQEAEALKEAAQAAGQSLSAYMLEAARRRMATEGRPYASQDNARPQHVTDA